MTVNVAVNSPGYATTSEVSMPCSSSHWRIVGEVLADRAHQPGPLAQQRHRVGDVRPDAAPAHLLVLDEEADAELAGLLDKDVLPEPAGILHQVVGRNRPGDDN